MRAISKVRAAGLVVVACTAVGLTGCGSTASPSASGSPTPSGSTPTQTAVPSPLASTSAPGYTIFFSRTSYPWQWPNDASRPATVQHVYPVPPMPRLVAISVGDHPAVGCERHYNRMSFTFTTAFPSYQVAFTDALTSDPAGKPITLTGDGLLKVTFRQAQAHTVQGSSSVQSEPPARLGLTRMTRWAQAGDFEGVLTFGIGIFWPVPHSNPQIPIRITEVEKVSSHGTHLYVVAIDVDAVNPSS